MKQFTLTLIILLSLVVNIATAQTIYVKADATGNNNGSSWTDAFTILQDALDVAVAGDEIWVAAGTYKPTKKVAAIDNEGNPTTERDMAFVLLPDVKIYGGFVGTETTLAERQLPPFGTSSTTILSGAISDTDSCYHVIVSAGEVGAALIDGLTITGGNANGNYEDYYIVNGQEIRRNGGGGMCNMNSAPTLTNVTISGNKANSGGGLYNIHSSPTLTNVVISENTASHSGGGVAGVGKYASGHPFTLINVCLSGNSAKYRGGGLETCCSFSVLTNVACIGNYAGSGGGLYFEVFSQCELTNVTVSGNIAYYGGGIFTSFANSDHFINLTNVTISGNMANTGGGMFNDDSTPTLRNTIVWGNSTGVHNHYQYNIFPPTYSHCLIQDLNPEGEGNIDGTQNYPKMFANAIDPSQAPTTEGDYSLVAGSPCINAGNNNYNTTSTDLAGNPRIFDGTIDMGAYEYCSVGIIGYDAQTLNIYPNPATNNITISGISKKDNITITDLIGRTIIRTVANDETETIDVSGLQPGIYLVVAGKAVGKLVVQ